MSTSFELPQSGLICLNCAKPASKSLSCPKCQSLLIKDAVFCSPTCFKDNYGTHKKLHVPAIRTALAGEGTNDIVNNLNRTPIILDPLIYPVGTKDAFHSEGYPYPYTGPLRAIYPVIPVPKRTLPEIIVRPDYALNIEGKSFIEQMHRSDSVGDCLTKKEQKGMREVCRLGREVLDLAAAAITPGITTLELDEIVHNACVERGAYPSPLGYHLFPRSVCTSINEVICHGIPDARPLRDGDILNLDVTLYYGGFHGDLNATYPVGTTVSPQNLALIAAARSCLDEAIRVCKPGFLYRDLGEIIQETARKAGFSVNQTYCGHGINQQFHCAPNVPHYKANRATGAMKVGQTFTIEPMLCTGHHRDKTWPDNWTAVTADGKPSAQFEETLLVTNTGVEVLTAAKGWKLPKLVKPNLSLNGK